LRQILMVVPILRNDPDLPFFLLPACHFGGSPPKILHYWQDSAIKICRFLKCPYFSSQNRSSMKNTLLLTCLAILTSASVNAQLPDGATAPNWTLTDIFGNTHTLYDYLDQGKTVVIDFSATWCAPCWNYHNSGSMDGFYEERGPDGTNES